jgi:methylated-DNA-[protein]-cysteine S-methyltransferase
MKFKNTTLRSTRIGSALGGIVLAATDRGLAGAWFDRQRHWPDMTGWQPDDGHPVLREAAAQLADYFAGRRRHFDLPLDLSHGTAFQQAVWQALLAIPIGRTTSYGALSSDIGNPAAVRAVGAAVGRNPISVIVPCHRVLGTDGSLTGYAGGLERKSALLALEGALGAARPHDHTRPLFQEWVREIHEPTCPGEAIR